MIMINVLEDQTVNEANGFLKNYGWILSVCLAAFIFLTVLVLFIIALVKKKKYEPQATITKPKDDRTQMVIDALGGKSNILERSLNGSRITLVLNDYSLVFEKLLNKAGITSVLKMSDKIILVVNDNADLLYQSLF